MPDTPVDTVRVHAYERLVVDDQGLVDVTELENIGLSVGVLDYRLHGVLPLDAVRFRGPR
jgi:hypothetical protein